jgi:hypothetical protein
MLFTTLSDCVSITSSAPGSSAIPTTTRPPSFVTEILLGWPLSGTFFTTFPLARSTTSSVLSDSLLTYTRDPSGAKSIPCGASIPLITCTTLFVAGSIT